ncbi:hypothetical protein M3Y99_00024300 [Aphelenchoides fujianensis]|nr:hypothetical protein M3Y99_00024300 [Aphelenchoides fujianensis]
MADYRRYSNSTNTIEEDEIEDHCCFGFLSTFTWLPMIVALNFLLDVAGACLALGSDLLFAFGLMSAFSLLCIGAVVSGVQEEQKRKIRITVFWVVIKLLLLTVLLALVGVALYDEQFVVDILHINLDEAINWRLLCFLPLQIFFVGVQFDWSERAMKLIAIRDEVYVIPCDESAGSLRRSLRKHLDKIAEMERARAKRYSLATVLPHNQY